jgi:hypothetical protein
MVELVVIPFSDADPAVSCERNSLREGGVQRGAPAHPSRKTRPVTIRTSGRLTGTPDMPAPRRAGHALSRLSDEGGPTLAPDFN